MGPELSCCKPFQAHAPSGLFWWHSRSCPKAPREKLRRVFDPANERRSVRLAQETADAGVRVRPRPGARGAVHLSCRSAHEEGIVQPCSRCAPILHPVDCGCEPCTYFWAHVDDEAGR